MLWLLAAQIIVMLPLMFYLPIWLLPVLIFSAAWRIHVMLGKAEQPGIVTKIILGIVGLGALKLSGLPLVSLEMTASLLILGFSYKSLEVIQRRDGMVVILTGFVLIGVLFLYSQSILITLYSFISVVVLTAAMIAIQQTGNQNNAKTVRSNKGTLKSGIFSNVRLASGMLLLCLPLMVLLFLFAPRFQPFWTVPTAGGHAKTGISDSMSPGDIANLSQSDELAFSVNFKGKRPKQSDLYWRGLVLQHFDGVKWTQEDPEMPPRLLGKPLSSQLKAPTTKVQKKGEAIDYSIIYQKTGQPWMFALNPVLDIKGQAFYGPNFRVVAKTDIIEPVLVQFSSYPDTIKEPELDPATRIINLQLPESENPKSRLLAEQLLASSSSKEEYIKRVLNRFREKQYFYTLRPPLLGEKNTIDGFLIDSLKGFCAHYAGSFVFMMRAAGIPARVVSGYQGGEWNEKGQFLAVHQFDAHAWTEVWLAGKGWQRLDPTAMVAPQRIEQNLQVAMQEEGSFLEGQILSLNKFKWLSGLRQQFDSLQYGWQRFVLNFDSETQQSFLKKAFGEMSIRKTMFIVGGFFGGIILLWVGFLGLARKRINEAPEHQLYRRFCALLEKKGITREISQTPEVFSKYAAKKLPDFASAIEEFTQSYTTLCYNPTAAEKQDLYLDKMKSVLKRMK
ncbi:MAG: transglutaminase-like putative cysteine protease [Cocleimonas sp.]|jgi:transglutaminase-like putative cysteine protease